MSIDGPTCGTCHRTLFDPHPCRRQSCPMGLNPHEPENPAKPDMTNLLECRHGKLRRFCADCERDLFAIRSLIAEHSMPLGQPSRQSHAASAVEATANVIAGFGVSVLATYLILPQFGHAVSLLDSTLIGIPFTLISLARSYALRRLFEILRTSGILP